VKLSIVLLTWNSRRYAEACINSIYKTVKLQDFEIIVIDNGSTDGTLDLLSGRFPDVFLVRNGVNKGLAPARNRGLKLSKGDYILILDIDTVLKESAVNCLVEFMDKNDDVGLCAPRLVFTDGSVQNSCRRFPLVHTKLLRRLDFKWAAGLLESEYYGEQIKSGQVFFPDYVIGACQLIRREALKETGPLDDKIFYGPEDVDFCLRMWLKGWKVAYVPTAAVVHHEQRITKKKLFSYITVRHIQGLVHYFLKHRYFFSREGIYGKIRRVFGKGY